MASFTVQVTRIAGASQPLQLYCRTMAWYTASSRPAGIGAGDALHRYYKAAKINFATVPHQFLFVPNTHIISINGQPIPREWIIDDNHDLNENMMVVDARWAETDFIIEEV